MKKSEGVIGRQRIVFCYFSPKEIDYTPIDIGCIVALLEQKFPGKYACEILQIDYRLDTHKQISAKRESDVRFAVDLIEYHKPVAVFIFCESIIWSKVNAFWRASYVAQELKHRQPNLFVGLQSYRAQKSQIDEVFSRESVDCIVMGDIERSFLRIDDLLARKSVLGTLYRNPDQTSVPDQGDESSSPSGSLDDIPSPYLSHVFDNYLQANQARKGGQFRAFLVSSRGCGFKCQYCFRSIKFEKVRYFRAKRFYDEMEYLFVNFGIRNFFVLDDAFLCSRQRLQEFMEEYRIRMSRHPDMSEIRMFIMTRPEMIADEETVRLLAAINVDIIQIGLQTVHPDLQPYMNRSIELLRFKQISDWMHRHKVRLHLDLIIGLPGDSIEWMKETLRFALLLAPYSLQIKQFYLNTNTLLFQKKDLLDIRIETGKQDFETPFVIEAKGIDVKYFDEIDQFIMRQVAEFPDIKWKYVSARRVFVSEGIYRKTISKQHRLPIRERIEFPKTESEKPSLSVNHEQRGCYDLLWWIARRENVFGTGNLLISSDDRRICLRVGTEAFSMIDQLSGLIRWIFRPNFFARWGTLCSLTLIKDRIYCGVPGGDIYSLDAIDGRRLWVFSWLSWGACPILASDPSEKVLLVNGTMGWFRQQGVITALESTSGLLRWQETLDQVSHTLPLFSKLDERVIVIGDKGAVFGFDIHSGEQYFAYVIRGWSIGTPIVLDTLRNRIIFGLQDGSLRALDISTGKTTVFFGKPELPVCDVLRICGDDILVACFGRWVRKIDLKTGDLLWEHDTSEEKVSPSAFSEQSIWILLSGGHLEEIDFESGKTRAHFQSDLMRGGQAIEYDSTTKRLFVSTEFGLLCLSRRSESLYFGDETEKAVSVSINKEN